MEQLVDKEITSRVQASYGRCLSNGDIISTFYDIFLNSHSDIAPKFANTDFEKQKNLLKHGINLMIMFAAGNFAGESGLKRIQKSHSRTRINIPPEYYNYWLDSLIAAITKHDRNISPQLEKDWRDVMNKGVEFISAGY